MTLELFYFKIALRFNLTLNTFKSILSQEVKDLTINIILQNDIHNYVH